MRERHEAATQYSWIVYAVAVIIVGGLAGYVLSLQGGQPSAGVTAPVTAATPIVDESELRAYREILARDPKNAQAAIKAGNLLYDAHRYVEAIGFYQQAFALTPTDINLSTDLGTALWYAGRADEALAQYEKSLAIDGTHAQTLFNVGIVRSDGKHDYRGAIAAWETLLKTNPGYPDVPKVQSLLADARAKL
ncbi:MAG: tetratricopeptide repeat protein [Acidobacteria bacterium]|nr:tetratricopeptide repeat protein [Acidobacteriota bacterium]